jgi:hypothetical protein
MACTFLRAGHLGLGLLVSDEARVYQTIDIPGKNMAVFGRFVGASFVLLIHRRCALVVPSLSPPSHRVFRRDMRGMSFDMGE